MKQLSITIPDYLDLDDKEVLMLLAAKLFELGKLSLGQAAELAGYSKRSFLEVLGNHKISLFNYDVQELENDIRNVRRYEK